MPRARPRLCALHWRGMVGLLRRPAECRPAFPYDGCRLCPGSDHLRFLKRRRARGSKQQRPYQRRRCWHDSAFQRAKEPDARPTPSSRAIISSQAPKAPPPFSPFPGVMRSPFALYIAIAGVPGQRRPQAAAVRLGRLRKGDRSRQGLGQSGRVGRLRLEGRGGHPECAGCTGHAQAAQAASVAEKGTPSLSPLPPRQRRGDYRSVLNSSRWSDRQEYGHGTAANHEVDEDLGPLATGSSPRSSKNTADRRAEPRHGGGAVVVRHGAGAGGGHALTLLGHIGGGYILDRSLTILRRERSVSLPLSTHTRYMGDHRKMACPLLERSPECVKGCCFCQSPRRR